MVSTFLIFIWCYIVAVEGYAINLVRVDMTYVFDNTTLNYPKMKKFETKTVMNGTVDDSYWLFYEDYFSGTHAGTHMDAPAHFSKNGTTIDQIPVSRFFAPAAVIDITWKAEKNPDAEIEMDDLKKWELNTGKVLQDYIILMRSGWGKYWGNRTAYLGTSTEDATQLHFPGISPKAAQWLVEERGVFGVGVDTACLDKGQGSRDGYPTHRILMGAGLFGLENVANVDQIPISGAQLSVLPMKIGGGSAAPARIIATYEVLPEPGWHPYRPVTLGDVRRRPYIYIPTRNKRR